MTDQTAPTTPSLGDEIKQDIANVKAFVQREETVLQQDVIDGYHWLKAELAKIAPEILAAVKAAIGAALAEIAAGESEGATMANVLTILARDGESVVASVGSDVLQALIGLTAAKPAA